MYQKLMSVAHESGIWSGNLQNSHAFMLSPSVFTLEKEKVAELDSLGKSLYECLLGISQIAIIAHDKKANYGGAWKHIRKVITAGVPGTYHELQGMRLRDIPKLLKLDLMVDEFGNFKIAEIDGHNKHGLGYSTLAKRFKDVAAPGAESLSGAVKTLAEHLQQSGHSSLVILYADQERFYVPEFLIAVNEFEKHGIKCRVLGEMEATLNDVRAGVFLDLPFMNHNVGLYSEVIQAYKDENVSFIIPPKPCFGAKGVLALLRNDGNDDHLESILRSFISSTTLALVRSYIPETYIVGKQALGESAVNELIGIKKYVLKESISSGMKGVFFSDEPDFLPALKIATTASAHWILQEQIVNKSQAFSWYESEREHSSTDWFMRVTVQYVNRKLGDVIVTARRDRAVHGSKDCIQLGTIIQ